MTPREFSLLFDRHVEVQKSPSKRELEVARLTAYMVVSSFSEVKSVQDFCRFDWDTEEKERSGKDVREWAKSIDDRIARKSGGEFSGD